MTRNILSIFLTATLAIILIYLFSIIGYAIFNDDFMVETHPKTLVSSQCESRVYIYYTVLYIHCMHMNNCTILVPEKWIHEHYYCMYYTCIQCVYVESCFLCCCECTCSNLSSSVILIWNTLMWMCLFNYMYNVVSCINVYRWIVFQWWYMW